MKVVIIGAGHAAGQLITSLKMDETITGSITLIGDEPWLPYQRPPLSKQYLSGEMDVDQLYLKPKEFYKASKVNIRLGHHAQSIDRTAKTVTLDNGDKVAYDKLALTTGTRVRRLSIPGADLEGIHYIRTIDDTDNLRKQFAPGKAMTVVGGGYIGLEAAAAATKAGMKVTVLEMADRVMNRVVAPEVSTFFEALHRSQGVDIRTDIQVTGFTGEQTISAISCKDSPDIKSDLCVVGVGVIPNTELAETAGLKCDNGIVVDDHAQTEDPDIVAAGDCTAHPNGIYGSQIRLESVQNAVDQAKAAALSILDKPETYCAVPWFWSNQYDVKLQIVGLSEGYDQTVVRGKPENSAFSVFYLKGGTLIAVDAINSAREYMMGRKLITDHAKPDPTRIVDTTIPIKELV
ncbi:MAG: FAD-dependent oxidoreductase [Rhodospirillales bacterium]|jgi:3-phenylpropionate/trans-cinnamate dioxygenase ferredoxin reductase component|nr:FAD-dependent oxidoreductase [Rhodospirillales bacterium]